MENKQPSDKYWLSKCCNAISVIMTSTQLTEYCQCSNCGKPFSIDQPSDNIKTSSQDIARMALIKQGKYSDVAYVEIIREAIDKQNSELLKENEQLKQQIDNLHFDLAAHNELE